MLVRVRVLPAPGFYYTQARALPPIQQPACPRTGARASVRARACPGVRARASAGACPPVPGGARVPSCARLCVAACVCALACCACVCLLARTASPACASLLACSRVACLARPSGSDSAVSGWAGCSGRWRELLSLAALVRAFPRDYTLDGLVSRPPIRRSRSST